jgi:hypothetical protein
LVDFAIVNQFLFGDLFLVRNRFTLTLSRARIVLGTLTTKWQTITVTDATLATNIHQSLDVHLSF